MKKGFVVSDMHMFSRRSTSARHIPAIEAKMAECSICILNGDIFDFRWTSLPSVLDTVSAAGNWLEEKLTRYPGVQFYFVCGNHDSLPAFRTKLAGLSSKYSNLHWHPCYVKLGPHVFLHGDILDSMKRKIPLDEYRRGFHGEEKKGFFMNLLYDILLLSQLHKIIYMVHKEDSVAPAILEYLQSEEGEMLDGVKNIFFGHTHVPFRDFIYEGIAFHNSGSMIRGLPCNVFEFEV